MPVIASGRPRSLAFMTLVALAATAPAVEELLLIGADGRAGTSQAVVVRGTPTLAHTSQILPLDEKGRLVGKGQPDRQIAQVLDNLARAVAGTRGELDGLVKLNFYVARDELAEVIRQKLAKRWPRVARPAVCFVSTPLPHPDALVALDAVFVAPARPAGVTRHAIDTLPGHPGATRVALMPHGQRVYVAGQVEKGDNLKDATRKTLESLRATLKSMRLTDAAVVQVKAFLMPMSDVAIVEKEVADFYGKQNLPAMVFVEWKASKASPIEIELIAYAGKEYVSAPEVVDYLTPPGMTSSPVFSRVCKVWYGPTIYLSGIYSKKPGDARAETEDVLNQLRERLGEAGSDLTHLVKATYYVSTEGTSKALNELRPKYYDPKRPPSASKALVGGVARAKHTLTLDMIATPTMKVPETPPEVGHGLTPKDAADGWISLFDGQTGFGWDRAVVEKGVLGGGKTTTTFGPCALRAVVVTGGKLKVGGKEVIVQAPAYSGRVEGGTIELGPGVKLKHLLVQPLGLKSLYDGKSLDGWKRIDRETIPVNQRPSWRVEEGAIVATGGPGALEYQRERFGDLVLQIDVKTRKRHANGGVFFRSIPGDFMNGYEAQVYNRCEDGDPSRPVHHATGGIDDRQNARRLVSRDRHYYRMTVIARGPRLATWINGYQVTDWTDPRKSDPNPRRGLRTEPGTIQLQAHDPATDVEFKNVRIGK